MTRDTSTILIFVSAVLTLMSFCQGKDISVASHWFNLRGKDNKTFGIGWMDNLDILFRRNIQYIYDKSKLYDKNRQGVEIPQLVRKTVGLCNIL